MPCPGGSRRRKSLLLHSSAVETTIRVVSSTNAWGYFAESSSYKRPFAELIVEESRAARARGLKQLRWFITIIGRWSRAARARGLKRAIVPLFLLPFVARRARAWIETNALRSIRTSGTSRAARARGLKQLSRVGGAH